MRGVALAGFSQVSSSEALAEHEEAEQALEQKVALGTLQVEMTVPSESKQTVLKSPKRPVHQKSDEEHERELDRKSSDEFHDTNWLTSEWPVSMFCNSKGFLLVLCLYVLVQSCVVNGLFPANISSIQQRYNLSATTIGVLAALSDIAVVAVASIVGYVGTHTHIPRCLSLGSLLVGLGSACFFVAWLAGGQYDIPLRFSKDACTPGSIQPDCSDNSSSVLFLFFIGQVLLGLGSTPAYALGPSYLDQVVKKKALPIHLGFFYASASVGPAIGFGVAAGFLSMWVDPGNQPNSISSRNFEWIGNWWAGFLIASGCSIAVAFLLFLFPKFVPHTRWIRKQKETYLKSLSNELEDKNLKGCSAHTNQFFAHMKDLFTNPTFIFTMLAQSVITFAVSGFGVFLPKLAQSMFNLSASYASLVVGLLIVFSAAGGTLFGGWLVKKVRVHLREMALFSVVITTVAFLLMLGFFFYGCNTISLAGVTTNYSGLTSPVGLSSSCNSLCSGGCDVDKYSPTCGEDGVNYFNPCFAGCQVVTSGGGSEDPFFFDARYANCTCVFNGLGGAVKGRCDTGCDDFKAFMAILFFIMFVLFMTNAPSVTVLLRSLNSDVRHLGMSVQNVVFRLLGSIPGPIIFGQLIDGSCALHATTCGGTKEGTCLEFEISDLRRTIYSVASISSAMAIVFFGLAWKFFSCPANELPFDVTRELDTNEDGTLSREEVQFWIDYAAKGMDPKKDGVDHKHERDAFLASTAEMRQTIKSGKMSDNVIIAENNVVYAKPLQRLMDKLAQENEIHHNTLRYAARAIRHKLIGQIFNALDTDNNGRLSREEIKAWVTSEKAWKDFAAKKKVSVEELAARIVKQCVTANGYADLPSLLEYFATWELRHIRKFSAGAIGLSAPSPLHQLDLPAVPSPLAISPRGSTFRY